MNPVWLQTFVAVFIASLMSLVGVFFLSVRESVLKRILLFLVSFSAGALLGGAFLHLLPEAFGRTAGSPLVSVYVLSGILSFFVLEKLVCWRHCHVPTSRSHPHPIALMNLIGDAFHNFIDGMVIAGSFMVSFPLGVATTIAVVIHEIPQEIGDFGILVYGGFGRGRALLMNFASAAVAFLGAFTVLGLSLSVDAVTIFLIPFTAGGFIYIASSDLMPELKKDVKLSVSAMQLSFICLGIFLMYLLVVFER